MKRRILLTTALVAGLFYVGVPRLLKRAFAPPRRAFPLTPLDLDLAAEAVWLESTRGTRLHAWFIPTTGTAPCVVALHGWAGNAGDLLPLAPRLRAAGFHALFLEARNHGLSEDDDHSSMPRFAEDLEVAVHYLRERDEVTSVGVIGHSVGASAAILTAARSDDLDAVVAVAAFADPGELMEAQFRYPRPVTWALLRVIEAVIGYRYHQIAPRYRIAEVTAPVLLVHGDADEVVPVGNAIELHERLPGSELLIVPGGTHSDFAAYFPYFDQVTAFLVTHLR